MIMILLAFIIYYVVGVSVLLYLNAENQGKIYLSDLLFNLLIFWIIWPFIVLIEERAAIVIWRSKK